MPHPGTLTTHLNARGLVPLRHLREGGGRLPAAVALLGELVDHTVLRGEIALDVGGRNGYRNEWENDLSASNWPMINDISYPSLSEQPPGCSGIPAGKFRQIFPFSDCSGVSAVV